MLQMGANHASANEWKLRFIYLIAFQYDCCGYKGPTDYVTPEKYFCLEKSECLEMSLKVCVIIYLIKFMCF